MNPNSSLSPSCSPTPSLYNSNSLTPTPPSSIPLCSGGHHAHLSFPSSFSPPRPHSRGRNSSGGGDRGGVSPPPSGVPHPFALAAQQFMATDLTAKTE